MSDASQAHARPYYLSRRGCAACAGLDARAQRLLFFLPSPEARRSVRVPLVALGAGGRLVVRTDLQVRCPGQHPFLNPLPCRPAWPRLPVRMQYAMEAWKRGNH